MIPAVFSLRAAELADRDVIAAIWHEGASLPGVGPAALPPRSELRQRVDVEFDRGWVVTIAEQQGMVVGFLAVLPEQRVLDQLFLRPDRMGSGIGRALFAQAGAAMPTGFTLFTRPDNHQARRFYEANGMKLLREDIHPRFGDPIVFYEWRPERG